MAHLWAPETLSQQVWVGCGQLRNNENLVWGVQDHPLGHTTLNHTGLGDPHPVPGPWRPPSLVRDSGVAASGVLAAPDMC